MNGQTTLTIWASVVIIFVSCYKIPQGTNNGVKPIPIKSPVNIYPSNTNRNPNNVYTSNGYRYPNSGNTRPQIWPCRLTPFPGDIRKYYETLNGKTWERICAKGTVFDTTGKTCGCILGSSTNFNNNNRLPSGNIGIIIDPGFSGNLLPTFPNKNPTFPITNPTFPNTIPTFPIIDPWPANQNNNGNIRFPNNNAWQTNGQFPGIPNNGNNMMNGNGID